MGSSERIQRQKDRLSESIIEIAMDILQTEGLESVTIRTIANKMEYSAPMVYSYFESKDAILCKMSERGYQKLISGIKTILAHTNDPCQQLQCVCSGFYSFAFKNPALYILMSNQFLKNTGNLEAPYAQSVAEIFKTEIRKLMPRNLDDVDIAYRGLTSLLHGTICWSIKDENFSHDERKALILNYIVSLISEFSSG